MVDTFDSVCPVPEHHCPLLKAALEVVFVQYDFFRGNNWLEQWWTIVTNWANQILMPSFFLSITLSLEFEIEIQKQPFSLCMWLEQ